MEKITFGEFESVELRTGTIVRVEDFPEAHKPTYKLWIDLGKDIGVKQSSARIADLYSKKDLLQKQVICVVNFPPKKIANFVSEVLTTGFYRDDGVVLAVPDKKLPNGLKLG